MCFWPCVGTVWPFQGCLCFQESTGSTWFSKYSKWASLDNVRNISAILRACGRRWRWSVLPSLCGVLSVECGVPNICLLATWPPTEAQVFKDQIFRRDSDIWLIPFQVCRKCMMARSSSAMSATTVHFFKNGDVRKLGHRITLEIQFKSKDIRSKVWRKWVGPNDKDFIAQPPKHQQTTAILKLTCTTLFPNHKRHWCPH